MTVSETTPTGLAPEAAGATPAVTTSGTRTGKRPVMSRSTALVRLTQLALLIIIFGGWELAARRAWFDVQFYGSPSGVWSALVEYARSGDLLENTVATLKATALSLLIGVPVGTFIGLLMGEVRFIDRVIEPFLVPLNSLPRIALAPLFLLWFGLTTWSKVWLATSIVLFVMIFNTRAGVKNVDPDLLSVTKLLGLSRGSTMRKVALPYAVPSIAAGLRLCVTYGLLGVVASEMIAARDGLGTSIVAFANSLQTNSVFAVLAVLAVLATVLGVLTEIVERRLLRWQ